jgi:hypothetical protein
VFFPGVRLVRETPGSVCETSSQARSLRQSARATRHLDGNGQIARNGQQARQREAETEIIPLEQRNSPADDFRRYVQARNQAQRIERALRPLLP